MTTEDLICYYANLLVLQYLGKPKAVATVKALVTPVIMDQLPVAVQNAFSVTGSAPAQGAQLDVVGKYVGVSRNGFSISGTPISLNDADFLSLIKIAVIRNNSGSSLAEIQALIQFFFPGQILVFDYQNMQMSYLLSTAVGDQDLVQLLVTEKLLPRPIGVSLASLVYSANVTSFLGFRTYQLPAVNSSPLNSYASYHTDRPWLSYANRVS